MNDEQLTMGVPRAITDDELMAEWFRFFGVTSGVRLLGWTTATAIRMVLAGAPAEPESLIRYGWGNKSTKYRNLKHLVALAEALRERGLTVVEETLEAEGTRAMARVVGAVS